MNGPGPGHGYPPHRPAANRSGPVLLRVLFVAVTVCTVGILCWVPLLRLAIVRRRNGDWALFWTVLVLSLVAIGFLAESNADHISSDIAMIVLLAMGAGAIAYYLVADVRHHRTVSGAGPLPVAAPHAGAPGPYGPYASVPGIAPAGTPVPGAVPGPAAAPHGYGYPPPHAYPHAQPRPAGLPAHPHAQPPAHPHTPVPGVAHTAPPAAPPGSPHTPVPAPAPAAQPAPPQPQPQPQHRPQRIGQVRAELDELSDLLRKEQGR